MKTGKIINERYFFDDNESGLYFDLKPIFRDVKDEDEDGLNARIDKTNLYLESISPPGNDWRCTLHLTEGQYDDLPEKYKQQFADKTYLFLYLWKIELSEIDIDPWHAYNRDGFVWAEDDKVYCQYSANELGHRFRVLTDAQVKELLDVVPPPPPNNTTPTVYSFPKKWRIAGKFGFFNVDLTVDGE